jgi:GTP-dependent phosphoenolpyruvate carboxykinase
MSDLMRETRMGVTEMRTMMRMNKEMLRRMGEMAELQKSLHHELAALQSSIMLGGSIP